MYELNYYFEKAFSSFIGECYNKECDIGIRSDFEEFLNYRITVFKRDIRVKLYYRITEDHYFQIIAYRFDYTFIFEKSVADPTQIHHYIIESQYKYDTALSFEDNLTAILMKRIKARYLKEGMPASYISKHLTMKNWRKISHSMVVENYELMRAQHQRSIIRFAVKRFLSPYPVLIDKGLWVAKCPYNANHLIQINVYANSFVCPFCYAKFPLDCKEEFIKLAPKEIPPPIWYDNLKNNFIFKNHQLKILENYSYDLRLDSSFVKVVEYDEFIQKQVNTLPLFLKTDKTFFPFDPMSEQKLQGQLIAVVLKSFFNGVETYMAIYRIQRFRLELHTHLSHYFQDNLDKRINEYFNLPLNQKLEEIKNCINDNVGNYKDIIHVVINN